MGILYAFALVTIFMAIGEFVGTRTKAYVPAIFVSAMCFLFGFWTFIPKDIVAVASFGKEFITVCMSLLLVHLGTLMNLKKLMEQWKAVTIALVGVTGTILIALTIGVALFERQVVISVTPPMVGGIVAALLMSQALTAKGFAALVAMPIAMFVLHSFAGYPLIAFFLKREGVNLINDYRANGVSVTTVQETAATGSTRTKLIPPVPEKYLSTYLILAKLILVGMLANWLSTAINGAVNQYVICLVLGVIFCELGFLEESALNKAGVFNWLIMGLLAFVFSQLSTATPQSLGAILLTIVSLLVLGIIGMMITSALIGRFLGYSRNMSFACALTALVGFPADYVITEEVCKSVGKTPEEFKYLMDNMLPKMLVSGFATVTIASVIIAGLFVNLL